ncbi:MAG: penicillin-binding protein 1A [Betaproteobacteria bacterium]|nr:penicillin-binding protein 1A [Betaproteobacteria bacterium]NBY52851.1 penicillin-binding protein 1A [Betaproteobacteria bacterium]
MAVGLLLVALTLVLSGGMLGAFAAFMTYPKLPSLEVLTDYRPKLPLRIVSDDGKVIGEFGEERRSVVRFKDVPRSLVDAILAAEDERFYQHGGIDYAGVLRAMLVNFVSGETRQGASTITMQVAKNFFLSSERTLTRKFNEALLSYKIESNLSKDQILELYINQIYLGQRSYGFAAAARTYFGKDLKQLSIAETAMLAGLPKAPSTGNPITNPRRARARMQYVLERMHSLKKISTAQYEQARDENVAVRASRNSVDNADFVAEMVRRDMVERFGDAAYISGITVYTTIDSRHQAAAQAALRKGVLDYEARHGWRGPAKWLNLPEVPDLADKAIDEALQDQLPIGGLQAAVVVTVTPKEIRARTRLGEVLTLGADSLTVAKAFLGEKVPAAKRLQRGSEVWLRPTDAGGWVLSQLPEAEAALVSVDPHDGAIRSLAGGFDAGRNQFNHVTQAWRQPGSSFKPFIYSAALEKGYNPATIVEDAPLHFDASVTGSEAWNPQNYDGNFDGPLRLRVALAKSKNMVAIRVLQAITPLYAQQWITRFGFDAQRNPAYLSLALGSGAVTPLQMVGGYAILANGGHRVAPYLVKKVIDSKGRLLAIAKPKVVGVDAEPVIEPRNAWLMTSLLRDVVRMGTATRAMSLGRADLAGKTGTTNDNVDAWFAGYTPGLVAVSWIGFDQPKSLGSKETGGAAALPIWIDYMKTALQGVPEQFMPEPEGIAQAIIDPASGRFAASGLIEYFYEEQTPAAQAAAQEPNPATTVETP